MRKLIFALNTTLDSCVDHTKQFVDEETLECSTHLTREADLQVFGRKTYQLMVPYWPEVLKNPSETKADHEFARAFDSTNKIVFSRSLNSAEGKNTRIVRANLRDEILKLKQEQGENILVGGVDIPTSVPLAIHQQEKNHEIHLFGLLRQEQTRRHDRGRERRDVRHLLYLRRSSSRLKVAWIDFCVAGGSRANLKLLPQSV